MAVENIAEVVGEGRDPFSSEECAGESVLDAVPHQSLEGCMTTALLYTTIHLSVLARLRDAPRAVPDLAADHGCIFTAPDQVAEVMAWLGGPVTMRPGGSWASSLAEVVTP